MFDLVILDWLQRSYTLKESSVLRRWVEAGGGLISMAGYDNGHSDSDRNHATALQSFPVNYVLSTQAYHYGDDPNPALATFVAHPITLLSDGGLLKPAKFAGGLEVHVQLGFTDSVNIATVPDELNRHGNLPVVVGVVGALGRGRFFIYGDEFIQFNSEWMNMSANIQQLWFNAIPWLTPNPRCDKKGGS